MTWKLAVKAALLRFAERHKTATVERVHFLAEELPQIVDATGSLGNTPSQTVSRVFQELREDGFLYFSHAGQYIINQYPIKVIDEDVADDVLENAINSKQLVLQDVLATDSMAQTRIRRGAAALRRVTMNNYRMTCAICDVRELPLLVTSHIARWADRPEARGFLTNTICFCAFHDALFENGFFSFSDSLEIIKKSQIDSKSILIWMDSCTSAFKTPRVLPDARYLAEHRIRVGLAKC